MKRRIQTGTKDSVRPEYDFSQGVRGKHFKAYREGTNVVFLDSDVAKVFADSASVNHALRLLLDLARVSVPSEARPGNGGGISNRRTRKPKSR